MRSSAYGARLGMYQANALGGTIGALIMFVTGHEAMTLLFGVSAAIGWAGWKRDYGLHWRASDALRQRNRG